MGSSICGYDSRPPAETGLRQLITRLARGHPEIEPIEEIVDDDLARFRDRSEAAVSLRATSFQPDSASQALAIRAVIREALNNIARQADATAVKIRNRGCPSRRRLRHGDRAL